MTDSTMSRQQKNFLEERPYHRPVLLEESIEGLNINPDGIYIDLTFGGGGHSKAILDKLSDKGLLYAFDQDPDAKQNLIDDGRFVFIHDNFSNLTEHLRLYRAFQVDGILADLGVSSYQIDEKERGFSTRFESLLDMRMSKKGRLCAREVINTYSEQELRTIFREYGELKNSSQIARRIVEARENEIRTTSELKDILSPILPTRFENKFFAMVFQALRIEVNNEMGVLADMLGQVSDILKPEARLVVISYHSLEDRLVKNLMKTGNIKGKVEKDFYGNNLSPLRMITRKPITASDKELEANPRSRSAKLRIAEKTIGEHGYE